MLFRWKKRKEAKSETLRPIEIPGRRQGVAEFLFGDVLTQVWANPVQGGVHFRVTVRKVIRNRPRDDFGSSFEMDDLRDIAYGANRAQLWFEENRERISLVTPDPQKLLRFSRR